MKAPLQLRQLRFILTPPAVALLAACASTTPAPVKESTVGRVEAPIARPAVVAPPENPGPVYVVKKGDTLYGIALDHGLDYKDIVAWNNLENPNLILIDQVLRMAAPGASATGSTGVITRPIAGPAAIEVKPIQAATAESSPSSETFKRDPKGGKQPYSVEALERLRKAEGLKPAEAVATATTVPATTAGAAVIVPTPAPAAAPAPAPTPALAVPPPAPVATPVAAAVDWMWPLAGNLISPFSDGSNKGIDLAGKIGDPIVAAAGGKVVYAGAGLRGYGKLVIVRHSPDYLSAYAHASQVLVKEGQAVTRGQKIAEVGDSDADRPKLHFEVRYQGKPVDPQKHLPPR